MTKVLVFDFDGVILESNDIKTQAFAALFPEYPEHHEAIRAHHLDNVGISRFEKFRFIYENLLCKPLDEEESQRLGQHFSELCFSKVLSCPFVPGAREALKVLAPCFPLYVASGTPEDELLEIVRARGLSQYFRGVYGSPREKSTLLRLIMSQEGVSPAQVLFIGDGESDYLASQAVGVPFFARVRASMQQRWRTLGVVGSPDLKDLPARVNEASL
ncbi:HAD family hydrolase [Ectothiorhodospira variabilis]|uniref:HAD family hydrolase n=1 Tax=Ectothiorhodospira variabilis TaxID=505694 RepID=UPI001EFB61C1|nr:HAD hydrolase-like protein [Ectothiorhodospira variabilis]MCG5497798.1 HAD hydrolase-like protein [Ectothiorhodospira variabilis]